MASFLARMMAKAGAVLPANPPDAFPGDDPGAPHELSINQIAAVRVLNATTGQIGNNFNVSNRCAATTWPSSSSTPTSS
jgi:hypothetical protein